MADLLELKEGVLPWEPPHAEGITILNKWGIPLSGMVRQHGRTFFFLCLEGEVTSANLWGYVPLEKSEEDEIVNDHTEEAFERLVQSGRTWIAALSVEDQGIVRLANVEDQRVGESPITAALRSLQMDEEDLNQFLATA